jgi:hypothetical protein
VWCAGGAGGGGDTGAAHRLPGAARGVQVGTACLALDVMSRLNGAFICWTAICCWVCVVRSGRHVASPAVWGGWRSREAVRCAGAAGGGGYTGAAHRLPGAACDVQVRKAGRLSQCWMLTADLNTCIAHVNAGSLLVAERSGWRSSTEGLTPDQHGRPSTLASLKWTPTW